MSLRPQSSPVWLEELIVRSLFFTTASSQLLHRPDEKRKLKRKQVPKSKAATTESEDSEQLTTTGGGCPVAGNIIVLCSVIIARIPTVGSLGTGSPLVSTLLFCFLSLLIWTVAVVGIHHLRITSSKHHSISANYQEPSSSFWHPTELGPAADTSSATSPSVVPTTAAVVTMSTISSAGISSAAADHDDVDVNDKIETELLSAWPLTSSYRYDLSTEDNYQSAIQDRHAICGRFADIRQEIIDHNFHKIYSCERQQFQDTLIEAILGSATSPPASSWMPDEFHEHNKATMNKASSADDAGRRNWIVFTAGVMGAGKSYTIKQLNDKGRFPLKDFVKVDPDCVRHKLPEFPGYAQKMPERAGELTRKEAGVISEILTEAALRRGQNVLVDGTLRNSTWYQEYFDNIRARYPRLQIGILHVTAPREAVFERALSRAQVTGRVVPRDLLESTMLDVPRSIEILSKKVDFSVELRNAPGSTDVEIMTKGVTWSSFARTWKPWREPARPLRAVHAADYVSALLRRETPQLVAA